jgi:hypothetical protein
MASEQECACQVRAQDRSGALPSAGLGVARLQHRHQRLRIHLFLFLLLAYSGTARQQAERMRITSAPTQELMELYALFDKVVEKHSESEKTKTETTESLCDGFAQLVCRANTRMSV